jgi:gamma-D-glutamyl-L-lysine dipeptidyl-peptidase
MKAILTMFLTMMSLPGWLPIRDASVTEQTAYIDVSVATLWAKPGLERSLDKPSITNPVNLWKWTRSMNLDEKLWLVGKLETQALLGNKVTIVERQGDWVKVVVHGQSTPHDARGYPGWMPARQLTYRPIFAKKEQGPFLLVTKPTTLLYRTPRLDRAGMEVSFNTRLPLLKKRHDAYQVLLPNGKLAWIKRADAIAYQQSKDIPKPTGEDLVQSAKKFLGLPYLWAGSSGFGFDCSGFTFTLHQIHGIQIPRDASPQSQAGIAVKKEELQPGDLLFFATDQGKGKVHHVTMYIGDGMMIHSPNSAKTVEIIPIDTPAYWSEYAAARRYLP